MIHSNITETIGRTPLVRLERYSAAKGLGAEILAKLEYFNPAGSIKDRVALAMVDDAEARGQIKPGSLVIEPTSGNTGIGLAMVCAVKGYRLILTMPSSMSMERRKLLQAYGAELVLTDASLGMQGAVDDAKRLAAEHGGTFIPGQFENPSNPAAHERSTGPEIWEDCDGKLDCFVACVGTGGTISGVGRYLKDRDADIEIVAVEPAASPLLSTGKAGPHGIQGIGANFVPDILDREVYGRIITAKEDDCYATIRELAKLEGIFVGISSAAALWAATRLAKDGGYKRIVVLMPDSGERYLSVDQLFRDSGNR